MADCVICSNSESVPLYKGIRKCSKCHHIFHDTCLGEQEINNLYDKNYFFGDEYSDYLKDKSVICKNFRLRLDVLKNFLLPDRHRRLLEIGCAYGFFLSQAKNCFDTVTGIDVTGDGIQYAKEQLKLNVVKDNFLRHSFGDQEFDVVCMWDTIEHLNSPQLYMEKIGRHTSRGALLAITTGDIESLNARFKKDKWRLIHPPTHIHYFSKSTLSKLLADYGFDIVYNRYCGFYRSLDMAAYRMFASNNRFSWLYKLLRKCHMTHIDFYLNLYDIMYVIAQRR